MNEDRKATESDVAVKWEKPKILLMDLPKNVASALQAEGYNVSAGTFGQPYAVQMDGRYSPLLAAGNLPNYTEQEIIFIDLSVPPTTDDPQGELHTSVDQYTWWVQHTESEVDPRPRLMAYAQDAFDRSLAHGGVIVAFALPRRANKFSWARKSVRYGVDIKRELGYDNWAFSALLDSDSLTITHDTGRELIADDAQNAIADFFRRHAGQMQYFATFKPQYRLSTDSDGFTFYPLIKTKFGAAAGGVIVDPKRKGWVFILPQCSDRQKEYVVVDLLQNVLTETSRHLFPHLEGGRWVQAPEYEHESILRLRSQQEEIRSQAQKKVEELDEQVAAERDRLSYLHGILTKKGTPLVKDVISALEQLGFQQIIDVDEETESNAPKQEDLQIHDASPTLLVEIKGLGGFPREGDTIQVVKYIPRRMKEWNRTDVAGVVIVNHQCNLPALERDHDKVFTDQQVEDAEHHDVTLVTTWELFKLLRGLKQWQWPSEAVRSLFYGKGRIVLAPTDYRAVGKVAHFYDKAGVVSIDIDEDEVVHVGDTVGYILRDGYRQEPVESLQIDKEDVSEARGGQRAGHKTGLCRSDLPDGTVVYVVS